MPPFQYRTYQNPYVGTIIDLMGRGPAAQARAIEAVGNIRAEEARAQGQNRRQLITRLGDLAQAGYTAYTAAQEDKIYSELLRQRPEIPDRPDSGAVPYLPDFVPSGLTPPPGLANRASERPYPLIQAPTASQTTAAATRRPNWTAPPTTQPSDADYAASIGIRPPLPRGATAGMIPPSTVAGDPPESLWRMPSASRGANIQQPPPRGDIGLAELPPLQTPSAAALQYASELEPGVGRLGDIARPAGDEAPYESLIQQHARDNDLDPALVRRVMQRESKGNPDARGAAGEQGLMQLMPGTARELGVQNPLDPSENLAGGARYLAQMMTMFGDEELALAAYNWGPRKVREHLDKGKGLAEMPRVVQDYVEATRTPGAVSPAPAAVRGPAPETPGGQMSAILGVEGGAAPGIALDQVNLARQGAGPPSAAAPTGAQLVTPAQAPQWAGTMESVLGQDRRDRASQEARNAAIAGRAGQQQREWEDPSRRQYVNVMNDGRVDISQMEQALASRGISPAGRERLLGEAEKRNASIVAFNQENRALSTDQQRIQQDQLMTQLWAGALGDGRPAPTQEEYMLVFGPQLGAELFKKYIDGAGAFQNLLSNTAENSDRNLELLVAGIETVPVADQQQVFRELLNHGIETGALGPEYENMTLGAVQKYLARRGTGRDVSGSLNSLDQWRDRMRTAASTAVQQSQSGNSTDRALALLAESLDYSLPGGLQGEPLDQEWLEARYREIEEAYNRMVGRLQPQSGGAAGTQGGAFTVTRQGGRLPWLVSGTNPETGNPVRAGFTTQQEARAAAADMASR